MPKRKFEATDGFSHLPKRRRVGSVVRLEDISDELILRILSFLTPHEVGLAARYEISEKFETNADRPVPRDDCTFWQTTTNHGRNDITQDGCGHESCKYPPLPLARYETSPDTQPNQPTGLTIDTCSSHPSSPTGNGSIGYGTIGIMARATCKIWRYRSHRCPQSSSRHTME
jgi:hypothetical protein